MKRTGTASTRGLGATVLAVALAAALLPGCSNDTTLTIYSGREEELIGPLLEKFASSTETEIDIRYGDSADLALLIESEGDSSPADVFLSQSPGSVGFLDEQGLLATVPAGLLEDVDERFRAGDGRWVGLSARQRVLVYNTELVDEGELPASVLELTDASYRQKVGLAPTNGSFQDFVTAMRQIEGDDVARRWLEGMVANESPTYADNLSIVDAVARGEVPMGLVNHYYNYGYLAENPDAATRNYIFPGSDVGSLLIASTASVLASTDQEEEAETFVEFMLSRDSESYYAEEGFEYPLTDAVDAADGLPPLDSLEAPDVDIDDLGEGLEATTTMISQSGLL